MGDVKATLQANVRALLEVRTGPLKSHETGISRLVAMGIALGTAQRVLGGQTSVGVDVLSQIAEKLQVQPWQLLVEGLNPEAPQSLTDDPTAWPFPMVDRAAYFALSERDRTWVQGSLSYAIAERVASSRKRPGAAT